MKDVAGFRCTACDPLERVTTYGLPHDGFVRVVDDLVRDAAGRIERVERRILPRGVIRRIEVDVSFGKESP